MTTPKIANCVALIVAGGESHRMGQNKADSDLAGKSLLTRMIEIVEPHFSQTIVSLRTERPDLNIRQIIDQRSDRGPMIGIYSALLHIEVEWLFAIGVDMPFMTGETIHFLATCRTTTGAAVAPLINDRPQPLAAFYHRSLLTPLETAINQEKRSLTKLLYSIDTTFVEEKRLRSIDPQLRSFIDIDRPEGLAAAAKWF